MPSHKVESYKERSGGELIDVAQELKKARAGGYAIGAFNTANLEVTKAICAAAAKFDAPILIQTTPSAIEYAGLEQLFDIATNEIKNSRIRAAIHLDHAKDFEIIKKAVKIGYKSIMFDGSSLPYEENIQLTHRVAVFAHQNGASVEGEVGILGHEEGGKLSGDSVYSTPDQVHDFVKMTGVDSVAVSVGNEHGAPEGEKVELKLLREISEVVDIPLVMHGSSGLSANDIREAIECGVAKFNIDTKIRRAFVAGIEESNEGDYRQKMAEGMDEVAKIVEHYIKLFSNK